MPSNSRRPDALARYRAKRSADKTGEPFGGSRTQRPYLFVVQRHEATRSHFDLRLEWDGVLKSWAVPKGPSADPLEKRLAVEVEDHPLEYADFEGIIPAGNYGAGPVIVWDRGLWIPLEDPVAGWAKGKLLFELRGHKLRGAWTLFRTQKKSDATGKSWLLMKKPDAFELQPATYPQQSILSGLTVDELGKGHVREREALQQVEKLGVPRKQISLPDLMPMLAQLREHPFDDPAFFFELKYDGFRLLASKALGKIRLQYRSGIDATRLFPDIVTALAAMPVDGCVVDGEVVVLEPSGKPSFQRLQKRTQLKNALELSRAAVVHPATLFVFDLLGLGGFDTRSLPLWTRKAMLEQLVPKLGVVRYAEHFEGKGKTLYAEAIKLGLEGIVAKQRDSKYRGGRWADWLKIRHQKVVDLAVVGFTAPQGARSGFGALHLATYEGEQWVYAGRVGTGFGAQLIEEVRKTLESHRRPKPPCRGSVPQGRGHFWVDPTLVCEVRYLEWTQEGLLRHPIFLRFRTDKNPEECTSGLEDSLLADDAEPPERASPATKKVAFSHLDKMFWPQDGLTKKDLIDYYRDISGWMLPYLRDRPVVMTRFPDGIGGKSFFQKDAPGFAPSWLRTEKFWSEEPGREVSYFILDDVESLLYVANMASIPLHVWSSRMGALQNPDWTILDLDPKGAPFADVVLLAQAVHRLCDELELPSWVKTTGSTGLHVLIPLGGQCTHEQARSLAELLARVVQARHPGISTLVRNVSAREGRVYLDHLQNGRGRLLVAPFSVRPLPGAPVSMPLKWSEVGSKLTPQSFHIRNAVKRAQKWKQDPMVAVLSDRPDLGRALNRLGELLSRKK